MVDRRASSVVSWRNFSASDRLGGCALAKVVFAKLAVSFTRAVKIAVSVGRMAR